MSQNNPEHGENADTIQYTESRWWLRAVEKFGTVGNGGEGHQETIHGAWSFKKINIPGKI